MAIAQTRTIDTRELFEGPRQTRRPNVRGRRGAIAAGHHLAALAGQRILDRGGNAIDAGVTAGISAAYERLVATRSGLYLAYDALQRSQSVAGGMQTEYQLGDRSVFDLMTAQNAVTEAQLRVTELQFKLTVAEHLLAAQVGRIDDIYAISLK